ncbi:trifunctional nucleotide phosphoesterase protein YfkN precursor [Oceanobacillus picturae]|uniref:Trifunctional nucleotide phosphoesterase protein YfkN n=1 Tax=Oceanobacillus picturae TaxID=171693 RepID=W9AC81_9BACI|nr:bifunctional UDP-sugar hydrolase/5'-nucleotidase [Oceanobacillus picturae]GAQ18613.1 trifunctional nucleotide phosphoesterase protein YfkN precursor [Oceanobacillus picturae]CDO03073.1 Trifunctional nucleotide phosphoesterase protein YfkN precursor [Oceanobacillus picturae]
MQEQLHLYYTNDLHSNFEQWPRVVSYLKEAKASSSTENNSTWVVDIGDHMDRVHPISEAFMGKANVELLNDAGYDVVTMGNNEGITLSHQDLFHLYDEAEFEVVCANLHSLKGREPNWLKPTTTIKSVNGIKAGFIGLTAPFNAFYELLDWHVSPHFDMLKACIEELKESTDIIILLSHLGLSEDQEIARRFEDIDVIIGGHTHHLLRTGEHINNAVITAAGKHCSFIGEVILTWDHDNGKLISKEAYATDISRQPKDLQTEQKLQLLTEKADSILGETVVHLEKSIDVQWFKHTKIMQELTETIKNWTSADIAMLNSGLLLDQLPAGDISYGDIHRVCPHPINACVVEVTGNELTEVVRACFKKDFTELKLKGFGFRGEVLGRMVFAGLHVQTAFHDNGEEFVKEVSLPDGDALKSDITYRVATADTFTFGRLLPEVAKSEVKDYFLPEFLRDHLATTLKEKFSKS